MPRVVLIETADNYRLLGNPLALTPSDIQQHLTGFVETTEDFVPLLTEAFPDVITWPRIIFVQPDIPKLTAAADNVSLRRLEPSDAEHLSKLDPESFWISKTWGGPEGLAASGYGWGAFVDARLVSVACTFFLGQNYEDIGVITEAKFRGLGLSLACSNALCQDIHARCHQPSWTTSPDNVASARVAEKLGFVMQRHDQLYVVGIPIPR